MTSEEKPFINLVEKIFTSKYGTPEIRTVNLEKEIDKMVYKFYGLREEEIEVVEKSNEK